MQHTEPYNKAALMQDGSFLHVTVATACPRVGGCEKGHTGEGRDSRGFEGIPTSEGGGGKGEEGRWFTQRG